MELYPRRAWHYVTLRNNKVRRIAVTVEGVTRRSIKAQCLRQLKEWARMSRMLSASACVQIWQRRVLAMIPLYAWSGDVDHMWFLLVSPPSGFYSVPPVPRLGDARRC
jgi:hypothetical protein